MGLHRGPPSALELARSSARPWGSRAAPELCLACHCPHPPPGSPAWGSGSPWFHQPCSDFTCGSLGSLWDPEPQA